MTSEPRKALKINCPELFRDPAFRGWLNGSEPTSPIATWHTPGHTPGEYSDVFMTVEVPDDIEGGTEGSDSDMPDHCWDRLVAHCRSVGFREGLVWLTNLPEDGDGPDPGDGEEAV